NHQFVVPRNVWKDFQVPEKSLISYVRNEDNELIGVVVARKVDGEIRYALSKCRKGDRFVKKFGLQVAFERINCGTSLPENLPFGFEDSVARLKARAVKYYK